LRNKAFKQKNGAAVRSIIGYARFSGDKGVAALRAVYGPYDRLLNCFYPCRKVLSKERRGAKVKKTYDTLMADPAVPLPLKDKLTRLKTGISLMREGDLLRKALDTLPSLADPVPEFVPSRRGKPFSLRPRPLPPKG
jgi:hypothetical protein